MSTTLYRRTIFVLVAAVLLWPLSGHAQSHGEPQPLLDQVPLEIETRGGPVAFMVEVAQTPAQQMRGLMFRDEVPPSTGMIFLYDRPRLISMWMKNTPTSLDMLFIDEAGVIRTIEAATVPFSETVISSRGPMTAVLEILAGEAERLGIEVGDLVRHPHFSTD